MKRELIHKLHKTFEDCAHQRDNVEYWLARELQVLLGYTQWRNFEAVIERAKLACENTGQAVQDHFADASKMIDLAKGAQREVDDLALTRYACYLIARNGDRLDSGDGQGCPGHARRRGRRVLPRRARSQAGRVQFVADGGHGAVDCRVA